MGGGGAAEGIENAWGKAAGGIEAAGVHRLPGRRSCNGIEAAWGIKAAGNIEAAVVHTVGCRRAEAAVL